MFGIKRQPYYRTRYGCAYLADSLELMAELPPASVKLVVTSPPFALKRKKEYGNADTDGYVSWLTPFAEQIHRILRDDGSFVLDLGGTWNRGHPTRSLYQFQVAIALTRQLFHLAQEFYWFNPSKLPSPAEWVTVRRVRVKDAVNTVWWFSKTESPDADNRRVLTEYSESMKKLLKEGYKAKLRPSGWDITHKFSRDRGGAIPPNLLEIANTESNSQYQRLCRQHGVKVHPARFPYGLPEFFVKFLTRPGELVYDCFGGSNVAGRVCEDLGRPWIASDLEEEYLRGSMFRFSRDKDLLMTAALDQTDRKGNRLLFSGAVPSPVLEVKPSPERIAGARNGMQRAGGATARSCPARSGTRTPRTPRVTGT
jgi:DNA modification methylase